MSPDGIAHRREQPALNFPFAGSNSKPFIASATERITSRTMSDVSADSTRQFYIT